MSKDGYSVTHREFLTAKEHHVPTIAFVESQVLNYKEVFDSDPSAPIWNNFAGMDQPHKTFALIDEVRAAESYNGLIPIITAGEAKRLLKLQIADFVGERLNDVVRPIKNEVQEILAEIKTLRKEVAPNIQPNQDTQKYLKTMRFLLDDKHASFRKFCEVVSGDLDSAVPLLTKFGSLDEFLSELRQELVIEDNVEAFSEIMRPTPPHPLDVRYASRGGEGWWIAAANNKIIFSTSQIERFRAAYSQLSRHLTMV